MMAEWHKLFFCMVLRQFTVSFKNLISGLSFRKQKGTMVFHYQEDINVVVIISLSSTKPCLSFFEILILKQYFWRNAHQVPEINLISSWNPDKSFLYPGRNKKFETRYNRRKTAEGDDVKINVSPSIPSQPAITCSKLTTETIEQGVMPMASFWCLYC